MTSKTSISAGALSLTVMAILAACRAEAEEPEGITDQAVETADAGADADGGVKCTSYVCSGKNSGNKWDCAGLAANAACTYRDGSGTTYGSGSGICTGTRSFSMEYDQSGKPTGRCFAPCDCLDNRPKKVTRP